MAEKTVGAQDKVNIMRRMYNWVLHWADTPWGAIALFILAFAESSFFPIPPDVLLIALCLGIPALSFRYALICTTGSILGAIAGYCLGYFLWDGAVSSFFFNNVFSEQAFIEVGEWYKQWDFFIIFTAGFTPIPYKLFTISAGVFHEYVNFWGFLIASIIGRGLRFFLVAWLIWKFGPTIKGFIDKYFNLLAIAFTVLLVGGFVLIKYAL